MLALFGPTAAGKSALAHLAARALDGEIVVADPFQRYRGLEIAADSPTDDARSEVRYHLVGDLDLTESSSAGQYARQAHEAIDAIVARGAVPVVAGGTGLYVRAALADLGFPGPPASAIRAEVEHLVAVDLATAVRELAARSPDAARRVDARNPRRVARALALARSGDAVPGSDALWTARVRHPTLLVGMTRPRPVLDGLIADRVRREIGGGLVAELEAALATPGLSREAAQIIGVREVRALLAGELMASELPDRLVARTRRLARAQLTWLRKTPAVTELDLGEATPAEALPRLLALWRRWCAAVHPGPPSSTLRG